MTRLWEQAFGAGDAYCDKFFSLHFREEDSLVAEEAGELLGMLHTVKTNIGPMRSRYLYAVATDRDHRNRGVFSALHAAALERFSEEVFFLIPEEEGLRDFYRRFSYRDCATRPHVSGRANGELSPEEAYRLYSEHAKDLPLVLKREEFFTTAQDKRFVSGDGGHPFFLVLANGEYTSFFEAAGEERIPTAMALVRRGELKDFTLPCFLN